MTKQTNSTKRTAPAQKSGTGIKALIMAASLAATIGGWGILAVGQIPSAIVAMQQAPVVTQPGGTTSNQTTLRQAAIPATQPRSIARTRSSR